LINGLSIGGDVGVQDGVAAGRGGEARKKKPFREGKLKSTLLDISMGGES